MTMCTFLSKRGATYYFRRSIPAELRPFLGGKAEFMMSLRTKDREDAKRRIPAETIASQAQLDAASLLLPAKLPSAPRQSPARPSTPDDAAIWERSLTGAAIESRDIAEKESRRALAAEAMAFLSDRIRGSTKEMPSRLRPFAYMIRDGEFDRKVLGEHLSAARAAVERLERDDIVLNRRGISLWREV